jgi:phosphate:Na+ symporter
MAQQELRVLFELTDHVFDYTDTTFRTRDVDAAFQMEPLEEVANELISTFKVNHLNRMGNGKCNLFADTNFINLLSSVQHIVNACTNIGEATVIRVRPELAANEHIYFETMRAGEDETYNEGLRKAREEYFGKLSPESMESMNL